MSLKKESAFHSTSKDVLIATHWRGLAPSSTMARRQVALGSRRQQPIVQLFDQKRFTTCFENGQKLLHLQPYNLLLASTQHSIHTMYYDSKLLASLMYTRFLPVQFGVEIKCTYCAICILLCLSNALGLTVLIHLDCENIIWCAGNSTTFSVCHYRILIENLESNIQFNATF